MHETTAETMKTTYGHGTIALALATVLLAVTASGAADASVAVEAKKALKAKRDSVYEDYGPVPSVEPSERAASLRLKPRRC
jgi:hypothetical protein